MEHLGHEIWMDDLSKALECRHNGLPSADLQMEYSIEL